LLLQGCELNLQIDAHGDGGDGSDKNGGGDAASGPTLGMEAAGSQSVQPRHFFQLHLLLQGFELNLQIDAHGGWGHSVQPRHAVQSHLLLQGVEWCTQAAVQSSASDPADDHGKGAAGWQAEQPAHFFHVAHLLAHGVGELAQKASQTDTRTSLDIA